MTDLHALRATFAAQVHPTRRGLLVRAVIVALDALIAHDRETVIVEHVQRVNGYAREGRERRAA